MTQFRLATHHVNGLRIVEVFDGDAFIAGIYPGEGRSFRVVSKYPIQADKPDDTEPNAVSVQIGKVPS